jgi:hypothetical protein
MIESPENNADDITYVPAANKRDFWVVWRGVGLGWVRRLATKDTRTPKWKVLTLSPQRTFASRVQAAKHLVVEQFRELDNQSPIVQSILSAALRRDFKDVGRLQARAKKSVADESRNARPLLSS